MGRRKGFVSLITFEIVWLWRDPVEISSVFVCGRPYVKNCMAKIKREAWTSHFNPMCTMETL